jgi:hypothetical protein
VSAGVNVVSIAELRPDVGKVEVDIKVNVKWYVYVSTGANETVRNGIENMSPS